MRSDASAGYAAGRGPRPGPRPVPALGRRAELRIERLGGGAPEPLAASTLGVPNRFHGSGWWRIAADAAIVLDVVPPGCRDWGFVRSDCWGGSFDCRCRQVHTNQRRAFRRADGSERLVVSHRDPRLPEVNWLDTAGRGEGVWTLRWLEADGHPLPEVRVVRCADLAGC